MRGDEDGGRARGAVGEEVEAVFGHGLFFDGVGVVLEVGGEPVANILFVLAD